MSDIFLSYKSEDAVRVARLAQALERSGLSVWWDRRLAGGESWHQQIQRALDNARCVVVVWTRNSAGPAGDFVRDEAGRGKSRGVLVPVRLDRVDLPLGFGEIQAIDLTRWKGRVGDPFFQDLVATVRAKLEGNPVPAPKGPMSLLKRRLAFGSLSSGVVFCAGTFLVDGFHIQERACAAPMLQPESSDAFGALGLGSRPARLERLRWESRRAGSCADLRKHLVQFPMGAYRTEAQSLLAARRVIRTDVWSAKQQRLEIFQGESEQPAATRSAAQSAALAEAQPRAEHLCNGFAATSNFRLKGARPEVRQWTCEPAGKGITCAFEGEAVCELEEKGTVETEVCDADRLP
jgi:TIR domain